MQMLAVDPDNDLHLDASGGVATVSALTACMQACAHAMKAQLGEMIYAADQGLPNFAVIWVGNPNLLQFEAASRATLRAVAGVLEVTAFSARVSAGRLAYAATIRTIYGEGELNG